MIEARFLLRLLLAVLVGAATTSATTVVATPEAAVPVARVHAAPSPDVAPDRAPPVSAQGSAIYRTTGPDGGPVFTDRPGTAPAEPVELSPGNTFDADDLPPVPRTRESGRNEDESGQDEAAYEVAIESPGNAETIRENAGNLTITARVEPELAGTDRLQLMLDGAPAGTSTDGTFRLDAMDRGQHRLQVRVIDERGRVHATSATHTIQLLRHSILNR